MPTSRKLPLKPKLTAAERRKRFVEMAKKVEASEDLEDSDEAFVKLTRASQKQPKPLAHRSRRSAKKASS
jgi:hypothetical protein